MRATLARRLSDTIPFERVCLGEEGTIMGDWELVLRSLEKIGVISDFSTAFEKLGAAIQPIQTAEV